MSRLDEFSVAESRDQGKTVMMCKHVDIPLTAAHFKIFASGNMHLIDSAHDQMADWGVINYSQRTPVGVAGLISPWNFLKIIQTTTSCVQH